MCYIGEGNGDPLQCYIVCFGGLSWWLSGKESACNEVDAGDMPLDCKEIQPVHSEGDQPWDFFGRNDAKAETPIFGHLM